MEVELEVVVLLHIDTCCGTSTFPPTCHRLSGNILVCVSASLHASDASIRPL